MFNKIKDQVDNLKTERSYFSSEWSAEKDQALLSFYVKIMPKMLDAMRCSIFIYDPSSKKIWLKCGTGVSERQIEVPIEKDSVVSQVITTGEYQNLTGLEDKPGTHKLIDKETNFVTHDILCIPIKTLDGKKVAGAVEVLNKTNQQPFTEDDRTLLEEMAHYLELTIESIYTSQKSADVLDKVLGLFGKIVFYGIVIFILIAAFFAIYWFVVFIV